MSEDSKDPSPQNRYVALVRSFPSIRDGCPGLDGKPDAHTRTSEWILDLLWTWISGRRVSPGERQAVLFCLNLWNRGGPWDAFDVFEALDKWDRPHQQAFAAWAAKPWRP